MIGLWIFSFKYLGGDITKMAVVDLSLWPLTMINSEIDTHKQKQLQERSGSTWGTSATQRNKTPENNYMWKEGRAGENRVIFPASPHRTPNQRCSAPRGNSSATKSSPRGDRASREMERLPQAFKELYKQGLNDPDNMMVWSLTWSQTSWNAKSSRAQEA